MKMGGGQQFSKHRLPKEPLGVGVIGVGRFGENHVRAYMESPFSQLIAIAEVDRNKANTVAKKFGIQNYYTDFRALLDNPGVQAVSIATPAHLHTEPAIRRCRSRKAHSIGKAYCNFATGG